LGHHGKGGKWKRCQRLVLKRLVLKRLVLKRLVLKRLVLKRLVLKRLVLAYFDVNITMPPCDIHSTEGLKLDLYSTC
jgi:hypothetical protein